MSAAAMCPHCGSTEVFRTRRHAWERLLFWLRAYRCQSCLRRYFGPAPESTPEPTVNS